MEREAAARAEEARAAEAMEAEVRVEAERAEGAAVRVRWGGRPRVACRCPGACALAGAWP